LGVVLSRETGCGGQRPPSGGHGYMCEGDMAHVEMRRVSHEVVEIKLLCFSWLSLFLKLV